MSQIFKAIYLTDDTNPTDNNTLTLAFGDKDNDIYERIKPLSSHEVRELLGYSNYSHLVNDANNEGLPLNTFCLWILRKKVRNEINKVKSNQISLFLNPIHLTFKGGEKDTLQRWYPYLEGYSPKFVEAIIDKYASDAKVIYDPFCGVGTTPLVASDRGLLSYYSEINPLLQSLTESKIIARNLKPKERQNILINLELLIAKLANLDTENERDVKLAESYRETFDKSKFFDDVTFEHILKARSLIDTVACTSPVSATLLTIAAISSLIPSSLLQRAGDLRFKTKEELQKKKVNFVDSVIKFLEIIINDIKIISPLPQKPILISEDAKAIFKLPSLNIDAVITSPPYLNGTNYFRNTKVELWFLRSLRNKYDLTSFRQRTITAGINDVSGFKDITELPLSISKVISQLELNAYDSRIPKMIGHYFYDMSIVFKGLRPHLTDKGVVAIDIGDSLYGNVHVPTDKLLIDVLENNGYKLKESVDLRKRTSRNGSILKQVLLVFRINKSERRQIDQTSTTWTSKWKDFKVNLPHHAHPYAKRNWGHPLHSLCSYQGKMKPSLAYYLVQTFASKGDTILDPFAGVGTIPFEAALNGIKSYGFDISPSALVIGTAKTEKPKKELCNKIVENLNNYIEKNEITEKERLVSESFGFNSKLKDYFEKQTLKEILLARRYFQLNPPKNSSESMVVSSIIHILHGNRPYALSRRSHGITPFSPTGNFEYKPFIPHLKEKLKRSLEVGYPDGFVEGKMMFQDATLWWPQEINNLDAIITSPPFFDSTRFHLANWMRLWFCGWNQNDFKSKPLSFVDETQKVTFEVYEPILRQGRERLKKGGVFVFHLGKSKKCDMSEELIKIARKWFKVEDVFSENVQHTESHGIRDKGTVVEHQFLVLS